MDEDEGEDADMGATDMRMDTETVSAMMIAMGLSRDGVGATAWTVSRINIGRDRDTKMIIRRLCGAMNGRMSHRRHLLHRFSKHRNCDALRLLRNSFASKRSRLSAVHRGLHHQHARDIIDGRAQNRDRGLIPEVVGAKESTVGEIDENTRHGDADAHIHALDLAQELPPLLRPPPMIVVEADGDGEHCNARKDVMYS